MSNEMALRKSPQVKVILVKYFFYLTAKSRMSMKYLIYVVQWRHRLEYFHLVWALHQVVHLSKILLVQRTDVMFLFPLFTNVDVYVGEQLQKALQPCISNIQIKLNIDSTLIDIVPTNISPVFLNDRLIIYALMKENKSTSFDHNVSLELYSEQHCLCDARINRIPSVCNDERLFD